VDDVDVMRTRIDVYVSTQNLMYLEQLKKLWRRKNYSQTVDHMITAYINLLNHATHTKINNPTEEKKDPIADLNKKYGIPEYD